MNLLAELRRRFEPVLAGLGISPDDVQKSLEMIRPAQDARFGNYQANFAMPLAKALGKPSREIAAEVAAKVDLRGLAAPADVAGPGFINVRLDNNFLTERLAVAVSDDRLGIAPVAQPKTYIVDFSAPNVAKSMHVGHIRSTVIGQAIVETLRFLGHRVIGDNHIGDWGTQFGMILYGYKHFRDDAAYQANPVVELSRLYRLVATLVGYFETKAELPELQKRLQEADAVATAHKQAAAADPQAQKKAAKEQRRLDGRVADARAELSAAQTKLAAADADPELSKLVREHATIADDVLTETAKLHAGDAENRRLWQEFMPLCLAEVDRIYRRLGVTFDETLGESFYHEQLGPLVAELRSQLPEVVRESGGAVCVFLPGQATPMIVQKKDGAYLYATTDLATIRYRMERWRPDAMLYVVDHRQSLHFEQLFAMARLWGYRDVDLRHISFGTVLGDDGRPFKTRSGDTVGLEGLLDEAVSRAAAIVSENDDKKPAGPELSADERARIADAVGIASLKYADLSQNRTSDYVFSYDKMLAMTGNTGTYLQYAYARVHGVVAKGRVDVAALRASGAAIRLDADAERALGLELLRFGDALDDTVADFRPNQLTSYLFELANRYSTFYEQCPVLKAETEALRTSRLLLCDLTARTLERGLSLLGIEVVEKM
ncbi:MAG: arginine--tRNA ligase [Pirellulales bacterium]|nr:arginine--tRNA ligase [Pirellulales bacterium]